MAELADAEKALLIADTSAGGSHGTVAASAANVLDLRLDWHDVGVPAQIRMMSL